VLAKQVPRSPEPNFLVPLEGLARASAANLVHAVLAAARSLSTALHLEFAALAVAFLVAVDNGIAALEFALSHAAIALASLAGVGAAHEAGIALGEGAFASAAGFAVLAAEVLVAHLAFARPFRAARAAAEDGATANVALSTAHSRARSAGLLAESRAFKSALLELAFAHGLAVVALLLAVLAIAQDTARTTELQALQLASFAASSLASLLAFRATAISATDGALFQADLARAAREWARQITTDFDDPAISAIGILAGHDGVTDPRSNNHVEELLRNGGSPGLGDEGAILVTDGVVHLAIAGAAISVNMVVHDLGAIHIATLDVHLTRLEARSKSSFHDVLLAVHPGILLVALNVAAAMVVLDPDLSVRDTRILEGLGGIVFPVSGHVRRVQRWFVSVQTKLCLTIPGVRFSVRGGVTLFFGFFTSVEHVV
jgi:hypothetical protein